MRWPWQPSKTENLLRTLIREVATLSVNQEQFDADLQDLVSKVEALIVAVNNLPPSTDFAAEDAAVKQAAADVQAELDKLNPPPGG